MTHNKYIYFMNDMFNMMILIQGAFSVLELFIGAKILVEIRILESSGSSVTASSSVFMIIKRTKRGFLH